MGQNAVPPVYNPKMGLIVEGFSLPDASRSEFRRSEKNSILEKHQDLRRSLGTYEPVDDVGNVRSQAGWLPLQ